ncbi:transglycosylase [soil metagenome]
MGIVYVLIAGLIIGLLGKFVAPGDKDNIPLWLTLVCGVGGVLIGAAIAQPLGWYNTPGVDWLFWIVSIGLSAVLVVVASTITGKNTISR